MMLVTNASRILVTAALVAMIFPGVVSPILASEDFEHSTVKIFMKRESPVVLETRLVPGVQVREMILFNGVILDARGYAVAYVGLPFLEINGKNAEFFVERTDGKRFAAELVGMDERVSLAVFRSEGLVNRSVTLGSSLKGDGLRFITAEGSSWKTIAVHVVSLSQSELIPDSELKTCPHTAQQAGELSCEGSIVVDQAGRFLGLVTGLEKPVFGKKIESFRILPVAAIRSSLTTILETGKSIPAGWLGITFDGKHRDPRVRSVEYGSPAWEAGLEAGDLLLSVDGVSVHDKSGFARAIRWSGPASTVRLQVDRGGVSHTLEPHLREWPVRQKQMTAWVVEVPRVWRGQKTPDFSIYRDVLPEHESLGLVTRSMNKQLAESLELPSRGLLVMEVAEGSASAEHGFQAVDVLLEVNGYHLKKPEDLYRILRSSADGVVTIKYVRGGQTRTKKLVLN